jgi:sec-independent protein translocase protein TatA
MGEMSIWHWMIVLLVVALLFGGSRLPKLGKELGEGIRSLKKGLAEPEPDELEPAPAKTARKRRTHERLED